jgi:GH15 family glucan-1,4-alpha-glucosidase
MVLPIEDYAIIGDMQTAALVGRDGSIDWLCLPRFDSGACLAALLGNAEHGHWQLMPDAPVRAVRRAYLEHTRILETEFELRDGSLVRVVDCMPVWSKYSCGFPMVIFQQPTQSFLTTD